MAIALVLVAAGVAGCGGSDQSAPASSEARVEKRVKHPASKDRQATTYRDTEEFCGMEPKSEFAVNEGLPAVSSDVVIARQYASEWPQNLRRAAFKGCLAGLATVPTRFPRSSRLAQDIWRRTFIVTSVRGKHGAPPVMRPIHIRLSFSAEREHAVGWQARCNEFAADVHVTATTMEVGGSGSTLIGCPPEIEEEDEWLATFMEADPEWRLEGERLQLVADRATIELRGFEDPNKCLISPTGGWVDLGNSGFDCESALNFVALYEEGKDGYLSGWECSKELRGSQARVLCQHGNRSFTVQGFNLASYEPR